MNSLPGIFHIISEQGRFLRWNTNFDLVTGYSAEEIPKMSPWTFKALTNGFNHHITKPIAPREVVAIIKSPMPD